MTTTTGTSVRSRREQMVHAMCAAVDRGDATAFAAWFSDSATYRFAGGDVLAGRASIEAATAGAAGALPWVRHQVDEVTQAGDQVFAAFTIHTADPAGGELALPCLTVIRMSGGAEDEQIADYRVYMDLAPAFASPPPRLGLRPADPEAVGVAEAAFHGLQRGAAGDGWGDFLALLSDDVRIMIPLPASEENPPEGLLTGLDIARALFADHHAAKVGAVRLEAKRIAANGPLVVIEARVEGELDGQESANHFVFAFEVEAGKVAAMYEYASWTAKSPASRWGDVTFAREAWGPSLIPAPEHG